MLLFLYRLSYTIISLSLFAAIYLINSGTDIERLLGRELPFEVAPIWSYLGYFVMSLALTWATTWAFGRLERLEMRTENIKGVEAADATFVPMYFAYVFVGVSIQSMASLAFCYALLAVICFLAQTYSFNPLFYVLGYKYYFVTNSAGRKLLVMSRRHIRLGADVEFRDLRRLNDFTYVDTEKMKNA